MRSDLLGAETLSSHQGNEKIGSSLSFYGQLGGNVVESCLNNNSDIFHRQQLERNHYTGEVLRLFANRALACT